MLVPGKHFQQSITGAGKAEAYLSGVEMDIPGNTEGGSITVLLTSCLIGLD